MVMSICGAYLFGQHEINVLLDSIEFNNKSLKAARVGLEQEVLRLNTGLTLPDPVLEADYMIGRPVEGGDQFDFTAVQEFEFPTVYGKRREVRKDKEQVAEMEYSRKRLEILIKAQNLCIHGVYLNKAKEILELRIGQAAKNLQILSNGLNAGEFSVLDVNKAKLNRARRKAELSKVLAQININNNHLSELNGGIDVKLVATSYTGEFIPLFEEVVGSIEKVDPGLKVLELQLTAAESLLGLVKAQTLPKFELGYHYQSVLGQTFNGAHVGFNISLWANRNKVSLAKAGIVHQKALIEDHANEHHFHLHQKYDEYLNHLKTLDEFNTVLADSESLTILDQLLVTGEITYLDYLNEMAFYYEAQLEALEVEKDLELAKAELLIYKL